MTDVTHHPSDAMLMSYASGALGEGLSLGIASHIAICERCADRLAALEAVGGALLDDMEPAPLRGNAFADVMSKVALEPLPELKHAREVRDQLLPGPLADYIADWRDGLRWKRLAPGLQQVKLFEDQQGFTARLLKIAAGKPMPKHGHSGMELTLVLSGGYTDESGQYLRGDLSEHDERVEHRPVADPDGDCVCLVVADAPVRLHGVLGRLFQPFVGV